MLQIGVIISSKGSAFKKVYDMLKEEQIVKWHVIIDRHSELESFLSENNIHYKLLTGDNKEISIMAKDFFSEILELQIVVLFYSRFITEELFHKFICINIHPSLLPAFPGMNIEKSIRQSKIRFLGATMHLVDEGCDTGEIIAQVCMPVQNVEIENIARYGYIHKIYLLLLLVQFLLNKSLLCNKDGNLPYTDRANPCLTNEVFLEQIKRYQEELEIEVI